MKIQISSSGQRFNISIPSGIVFNRATAVLMPAVMKKNGINISVKASVKMIKELNNYRKNNPEWYLVEINSSKGDTVRIKL